MFIILDNKRDIAQNMFVSVFNLEFYFLTGSIKAKILTKECENIVFIIWFKSVIPDGQFDPVATFR